MGILILALSSMSHFQCSTVTCNCPGGRVLSKDFTKYYVYCIRVVDIAVPVITIAWEVNVYIVIEFCYQIDVLTEVDQIDALGKSNSCIEQEQTKGDGTHQKELDQAPSDQ